MFMKAGRLLLAAATALLLAPAVAGAAEPTAAAFHDAAGITVDSATQTDARTWHLVVSTAELSRPVRVDVLLPVGYADSTRSYPVLYLFHGTSGGADDWLDYGNAESATASYPMIVVMPDAGYDGDGGSWFTDWFDQHTALGTSDWESFHIDQLIPWTDDNLRTDATRAGRAVAGLSQGGFGAFSYAARHPDLFASAASFSGAPDIASNPVVLAGASGIIVGTATGLDHVEPFAMFGDPLLHLINWQGHNPASLVTNLAHTDLELWTGNGIPGPLAPPGPATPGASLIEGATHTSTLSFAQVAGAHHVAYTLDDYGAGTHEWPYWARDLTQYLPGLQQVFAHPSAAPTSIDYTSVDKAWTQWGWHVVAHRAAAQAWSALSSASARGFTLTGGPATVTTPADYPPGSRYTVGGAGSVTADAQGRLTVDVPARSATVTIAAAP